MATENQYCTFSLDDTYFGIDVAQVQEVMHHQAMTRVQPAPPEVKGIINLRGQLVTAVDLRHRLGLSERPADRPPMNVVLRGNVGEGLVSLLVDEIGDVLTLSDDLFEPPPETLRGEARELIKGAYKLKQRLLLILDTEKALKTSLAEAA